VTSPTQSETGADQPLVDEICRLVISLAGHMQRRFNASVSSHGLSPAQARLLRHLQPDEAIPMRELAARLQCDPSNLTDLVDKLEAGGMLERRQDAHDRRVKALVLTEEGVRLRDEFWHELLAEALPGGPLPRERALRLRDLLVEAMGPETPPP
jgi:DNA-binding MarR family transcriptional regulator